jgi:pilus assembly protein CpaB
MKLSRVAVLGVAVGAGLIAAVLALNLTRPPSAPGPTAPAEQVKLDTVEVLVASRDVPMGATIPSDALAWHEWPKDSVSSNFITKGSSADPMADATGAFARAAFYAGEPISEAKLIHTDRGFMSAILPEGKRAVAVKIAADTSAGGFILPNDHVDVIMTRRNDQAGGTAGGQPEFTTETVLNNVRVLAIDQTIEKGATGDNGEVVVGQTATLELTPEQAKILTVAQQMSDRLALALRSISDSTVTPADSANDATHLIAGGGKSNGTVTVVRNGVATQVTGIR